MGKRAKSSRKGKKAWRANISTEDIEDYFEKSTKDALSGGSLADVPSDSLFFVDKSRDLSVKRKIERSREKVLRCDSLLQRNPFVKPIPSSIQKKKKSKKNGKAVHTAKDKDDELGCQGTLKEESAIDSGILDLWEEKGEDNAKIKKKPKASIIPAVEVEHPGCSFNPHPESHQDALAHAVADEMQKKYQHELGPEPIPLVVPGEVVDEEDKYFLEADGGSDEDVENENQTDNEDADAEKRPLKTKRITRVELNRRARRKEQLRAEAESKKVEELSKDIDRFDPAPLQVLLSEEKTGSLRQLKGCCTLVKDRFKSLEKRGLVIPSKKSGRVLYYAYSCHISIHCFLATILHPVKGSCGAPLFKVKKHAEYRRLATVKETHTAASGYSSELHNFV
ncbi:UNVERIFIED_CONTAM: Ribosome biogenesis protein NOP53 [Sesamum angustifolium]|uniref:Ribosome biogenesis protein NOP53 n=1 Tax=Sesamum angustifolium TaxID=2727405 RepID=A0AAW2P2N1_9LAMI